MDNLNYYDSLPSKSVSNFVLHVLQKQDDNEHMAYWLANTSTLLFLLQRSLKATTSSSGTPTKRQSSLFERMTQVIHIASLISYFSYRNITIRASIVKRMPRVTVDMECTSEKIPLKILNLYACP